ncbi:AraC-type DNA-binding protein [Tangfeifania diversioriginum]|uniref:AraC-type DNA-binding protein n=1 Tax=Tangfeifania diversioriginum TaxID=1168035 RepID=A0A1M6LBS3_9BACT|nr:helix-turn-helix domain-containing protein [Tangfeifania diversioriginum]SHJ68592.1 AraC-type DNA-binding protein [Tangfeifania diversioriginum]
MENGFIHRLTKIIDTNLHNEHFGPEELAAEMGMSYSSLHRRLKENLKKNISIFIRERRLEKAKEILQNENLSVAEIAYKVGFGSPTYFNKCFHEYFGISPGEFKKGGKNKTVEAQSAKGKFFKVLSLAGGLIVVFALAYFFLNGRISGLTNEVPSEKSIAVLPVKYIGPPTYQYQAEGCMEELLDKLMKLEDLRVISRTSVEKYRQTSKSIKDIGKELKVSAMLESTFQKTEEGLILFLKLYRAENEELIWQKKFQDNLANVSVFQNEAAQLVAGELHVRLSPTEKQLLEKINGTNVEAQDFFRQGRNQFFLYQMDNTRKEALNEASIFFEKALAIDSAHAPSYAALATVYWEKNYNTTYFEANFLDSAFYLAQRALDCDKQSEEAYLIRGKYYYEMNDDRKALTDIQNVLEINPNFWEAYSVLSRIYTWRQPDFVKAIENGQKAISLNQGPGLAELYSQLGFAFACAGFKEEAKAHFNNAFDLTSTGDSLSYYLSVGTLEQYFGDYLMAEKYLDLALACDSGNVFLLRRLGGNNNLLKNYSKSLYYYQKWMQKKDSLNILDLGEAHRIGLAYAKTGQPAKANEYFALEENYCLEAIEKQRDFAQNSRAYYDLAAVYAFQGKKAEAYELLDEFIKNKTFPLWWVNLAKDDPLFEKIVNEKRFNELLVQMEKKYLSEHERVKKWMEENDLFIENSSFY